MILTLNEYKQIKGIYGTGMDTQISALLPLIDDSIKAYCKWDIERGDFTEKKEGFIDVRGYYFFTVKNYPIVSIDSVTIKFTGVDTPMTVDVTKLDTYSNEGYMLYAFDLIPGDLVIRNEYRSNFSYTVEYTGGYATADIPDGLKMAAVMAMSDALTYFQGDQVVSGSSTPTGVIKKFKIGDYSIEAEGTAEKLKYSGDTNQDGIILSTTVRQLLKPYVHTGQSMVL